MAERLDSPIGVRKRFLPRIDSERFGRASEAFARAMGTDTEYLAREVVALRLAMEELATKDFVRDELRDLMRELLEELRENPKKK